MPGSYNKGRILNFMMRIKPDDVCFALSDRHHERYDSDDLPDGNRRTKSQHLIKIAKDNNELGLLVFHLVYCWKQDLKGRLQIVVDAEMHLELEVYRQELAQKGEAVQCREVDALLRSLPPPQALPPVTTPPEPLKLGPCLSPPLDPPVIVPPVVVEDPDDIGGTDFDPDKCASGPTIFICYSQKDAVERDQLVDCLEVVVQHLSPPAVLAGRQPTTAVALRPGAELVPATPGEPSVKVWFDGKIGAGAIWRDEIKEAIDSAHIAILLVSTNFINSRFIPQKEIPRIIERARTFPAFTLYPILATHTHIPRDHWLNQLQIRPSADRPVWGGNKYKTAAELKKIAIEIEEILRATLG